MRPGGRLLAICGIDGSGKTLQTRMLCERARRSGWLVRAIEFPRYEEGFFGALIARYLKGEMAPEALDVDPYLAALPFACDRWEALPVLRSWLEEGALVVCNRYVAANLAHQGGKLPAGPERDAFLHWVERLEYDVFGLPRPDLQVLLDMPPQVAVRLLAAAASRQRHGGGADIHESSLTHLGAAREVYRQLASGRPGWVTIPCAEEGRPLPPEAIAGRLWRAVSAALGQDA